MNALEDRDRRIAYRRALDKSGFDPHGPLIAALASRPPNPRDTVTAMIAAMISLGRSTIRLHLGTFTSFLTSRP
jgi:hypothetical protein